VLFFQDDVSGALGFPHAELDGIQIAEVSLQMTAHGRSKPGAVSLVRMWREDIDIRSMDGGNLWWPFTLKLPTAGTRPANQKLFSNSSSNTPTGDSGLQPLACKITVKIVQDGRISSVASSLTLQVLFIPPIQEFDFASRSVRSPSLFSAASIASPRSRQYTISEQPWKEVKCPTVIMKGSLWGKEDVEVRCDLIIPHEYPSGHLVPLKLSLTSTSVSALDTVAQPHAVNIRMHRVVSFGSKAGKVTGPVSMRKRGAYGTSTPVAQAKLRLAKRPYRMTENPAHWRADMSGELHPLDGQELSASSEFQGMAIVYNVNVYTFSAKGFEPSNPPDRDLLIAKLTLR